MQSFYLISTVLIWAVAWVGGAAPERRGVLWLMANYLAAGVLDAINWDALLIVNDAVLLGGLLWLSARYRRWWVLLACAMQILIVTAHWSYRWDDGLLSRTDVLYRYLLGVIGLYALGLGVIERWLALDEALGWRLQVRG